MKIFTLPLALLLLSLLPTPRASAQASTQDSLILVDLYNSTNGPGWTNHTNWLTSAPLSTWYGVFIQDGVHVVDVSLSYNHLVGTLPSSLGNFTNSTGISLELEGNLISGSLPVSLLNLPGSAFNILTLSHNQLSGAIPQFPATDIIDLDISSNKYTFASLEPYIANDQSQEIIDSIEADLPLIQSGNILSIAAGGTLSNNTYTWYKDGAVVATNTGDSTFTMTGTGTYSVSVTNAKVPGLTLYSIQNLNTQDSLALIDLYNSTAGSGWSKNTNWATAAPAASWDGIVTRFGRVQTIYLPDNNLTGPLPSSLSNLTAATSFNFYTNNLNGSIPSTFGNLQSLRGLAISTNQLTGGIPAELSSLSNLTVLDLDHNLLTGSIPTSLGNLGQLETLNLNNNQLSGSIPSALGNLTNLKGLYLFRNLLTDTIPASIWNLTNLNDLEIYGNALSGQIPNAIGRLHNLNNLVLNDNQFTGTIPDSICYIPNLYRILLFDNQLTGTIPALLGNDTQLLDVTLENNNLSGTITANFSALTVDSLNLSGNQYTFSAFPVTGPTVFNKIYAPQQNVLLTRAEAKLSVSTGGNSAHSTYTLFKNGAQIATQTGDSSFTILGLGNYNIVTTNTDVPTLTLYSDTLRLGFVLPDSTITTIQNISGDTTTNIESNIFLLTSLTPTAGANALSGNVGILETVDSSIQTFDGAPYVQRHYDITPTSNASTSQATITLYFTQADFDAYNAYVTAHNSGVPLLPTGGVDNGHIIITQYHGSFTGTSSPANYSQGAEVIRPTVAWDSVDGWWTVTFPVNGFSGFFLGSGSNPLPLTLLQFTGIPQGSDVNLQWQTTDEIDTKQFIVQHSPDGNSFAPIGTVTAKNTTSLNNYAFTDTHPSVGNNFYRLKMQDYNGQFTYSPIVEITMSTLPTTCLAYPNPATTTTSLRFTSASPINYTIEITDLNGHILTQIAGTSMTGLNKVDIDVHAYAPGAYTITLIDQQHGKQSIRLSKE